MSRASALQQLVAVVATVDRVVLDPFGQLPHLLGHRGLGGSGSKPTGIDPTKAGHRLAPEPRVAGHVGNWQLDPIHGPQRRSGTCGIDPAGTALGGHRLGPGAVALGHGEHDGELGAVAATHVDHVTGSQCSDGGLPLGGRAARRAPRRAKLGDESTVLLHGSARLLAVELVQLLAETLGTPAEGSERAVGLELGERAGEQAMGLRSVAPLDEVGGHVVGGPERPSASENSRLAASAATSLERQEGAPEHHGVAVVVDARVARPGRSAG